MDAEALRVLIPVLALSIPVAAIVFNGLAKVTRERALANRSGDDDLRRRLDAVEDELGAVRDEASSLRHELMETQERVDFAERLLAQRAVPAQQLRRPGEE